MDVVLILTPQLLGCKPIVHKSASYLPGHSDGLEDEYTAKPGHLGASPGNLLDASGIMNHKDNPSQLLLASVFVIERQPRESRLKKLQGNAELAGTYLNPCSWSLQESLFKLGKNIPLVSDET